MKLFKKLQILVLIYYQWFGRRIVLGACKPLIPKDYQNIQVTCLVTSLQCMTSGTLIPSGGQAEVNCLDNYEPSNSSNGKLVLTCERDRWIGQSLFDQMICKIKCGQPAVENVDLNFNRTETSRLKWPWHVAIFRDDKYICGGSIVNPVEHELFILTSGICTAAFDGSLIRSNKYKIVISAVSTNLYENINSSYTQILGVKRIVRHENYDIRRYTEDIALLQTDKPIKVTSYSLPICLPSDEITVNGQLKAQSTFGTVVGFGSDAPQINSSEKLKEVTIPVISTDECDFQFHQRPLSSQICAGSLNGINTCRGDTGGGFVSKTDHPIRYAIQGIASAVPIPHNSGQCFGLTIFTKVFYYVRWIQMESNKFISILRTENSSKSFRIDDLVYNYESKIKEKDGGDSEIKDHTVQGNSNTIVIVSICATIVAVVILIGAVVVVNTYLQRKPTVLSDADMQRFLLGDVNPTSNTSENTVDAMAYDQEYEIDWSKLRIDLMTVLGSGAFGIVFQGIYGTQRVAVKTVRAGTGKKYLISLLSELKIMIFLKRHPNLVSLVGARTRDLRQGQLYIVVELCPVGSLEGHLKRLRNTLVNNRREPSNILAFDSAQLFRWGYQICLAMEYLESMKVIHSDLAARNVLLTENLQVKVSDFGLSRKLYQYDVYVKEQKVPLPWRWMATESLQRREFSHKSDCWSFGVTLWEIYSMGDLPYHGMEYTVDFVDYLCGGMRLGKPNLAPENIFVIMQKCWNNDPNERPAFSMVKALLSDALDIPSLSYDEFGSLLPEYSQFVTTM